MKQYKHPKLSNWKVIQQQFSDVYTDINKYSITSPNWNRTNDVSVEELLALWFEESGMCNEKQNIPLLEWNKFEIIWNVFENPDLIPTPQWK